MTFTQPHIPSPEDEIADLERTVSDLEQKIMNETTILAVLKRDLSRLKGEST